MTTALAIYGRLQRVQRLSPECPNCGGTQNEWRRSLPPPDEDVIEDSVTLRTVRVGEWVMTWLHCEWCQADYDPLDANPLCQSLKLEA